ncbi:carboxypeptidase regulatory-like domain-containing protein [Vibrio ponticus]|uniref:Carboxypeptidase regulatory-like domain-containing protein n=1 Tax=Vibrio ponticus TaxID=265668 RepID=A0A3N3DZC6_9VIBR|nr:carboxypeptidase-like regulatory domain-containing protein [Vibrio ponticus]ROV59749.1 carboxypeptidase regulatory-like domain-containing protein [Vibrio ponticus]
MDEDEEPFLHVENVALYLLSLQGQCINNVCRFHLPDDIGLEKPPYYFNLNTSECRFSDEKTSKLRSVIFEQETYIHWQSLDECLPIRVHWNLDEYKLTLTKLFKTLAELEKKIQKMKKDARDEALAIASKIQPQVYLPSEEWGFSSRALVALGYDNIEKAKTYVLSDSLISSSNTLTQISIDSRNEDILDYYNLAYQTDDGQGTAQIGNVLVDGSIFSDSWQFNHGFYYTNRHKQTSFGSVKIQNSTKPNIEIDLLVNGIYRNTYNSDSFGRFTIDEQNISPGDTLTFRYYLGEGLWSEEELIVAGINEQYLPKGEWLSKVYVDLESGKSGATQLSYGLGEYVTVGASFFKTDTDNFIGLQSQILATHWLSTSLGWLPELDLWPVEVDMLFSRHQSLALELNKTDSLDPKSTIYHRLGYSWYGPFASLNLNVITDEFGHTVSSNIGKKITDNIYLSYRTEYQYFDVSNYSKTHHEFELTNSGISDLSWGVTSRFDNLGRHQTTSLRLRGDCSKACYFSENTNLTTSISMMYDDTISSFNWYSSFILALNPHVSLNLSGNDESVEFTVELKLAGQTNLTQAFTDRVLWDEYSYSKVEGRVTDQEGNPIANVKLKLLNQNARTDNNGYYQFNHIPARKKIPLTIDESSLDLSLTTKDNPVLLNTREISSTTVNIILDKTFGIDGFVNIKSGENVYIYFKHLNKREEYASVVEEDGFYMVEGLVEGHYMVTLEVDGNEYVKSMTLDSDFWISDLNFDLNDFEPVESESL